MKMKKMEITQMREQKNLNQKHNQIKETRTKKYLQVLD